MNKATSPPNPRFEHLLWKNELEFNRRELAIFESYLLNRQGKILPQRLTEMMSQLHDYVRSVNKLLEEISVESSTSADAVPANQPLTNWQVKRQECCYIREEKFYFEQNYHQFRNQFCTFAAGLEAA